MRTLLLIFLISASLPAEAKFCLNIFRRLKKPTVEKVDPALADFAAAKQEWTMAVLKGNMLFPQLTAGILLYSLAQYIKRPITPFSKFMAEVESHEIDQLVKAMNKAHAHHNIEVSEPGPSYFKARRQPGQAWFVEHLSRAKRNLSTELYGLVYALEPNALKSGNYDTGGIDAFFSNDKYKSSKKLLQRIAKNIEDALTDPEIIQLAKQRREILKSEDSERTEIFKAAGLDLALKLRNLVESKISEDLEIDRGTKQFMLDFFNQYVPWR